MHHPEVKGYESVNVLDERLDGGVPYICKDRAIYEVPRPCINEPVPAIWTPPTIFWNSAYPHSFHSLIIGKLKCGFII